MNYLQKSNPNEDNALKDINFDSIEFDNVNFGYIKNGNLIFKDLSFQISKGDVIGIYGPSVVEKVL